MKEGINIYQILMDDKYEFLAYLKNDKQEMLNIKRCSIENLNSLLLIKETLMFKKACMRLHY